MQPALQIRLVSVSLNSEPGVLLHLCLGGSNSGGPYTCASENAGALILNAGAASMRWEQHRLAPGITKIGTS